MKNVTFTNLSRDVKGRFLVSAVNGGGYQLDANCNPLKLTARQFNTFVRTIVKNNIASNKQKDLQHEVVIRLNDCKEWEFSHLVK